MVQSSTYRQSRSRIVLCCNEVSDRAQGSRVKGCRTALNVVSITVARRSARAVRDGEIAKKLKCDRDIRETRRSMIAPYVVTALNARKHTTLRALTRLCQSL